MKLRFLLVWCIIFSLLCGCSGSTCEMYSKDGKWYIEVPDSIAEEQPGSSSSNASIALPEPPKFSSAKELKKMLRTGDIPEDYIRVLSRIGDVYDDGTKKLIEICDPNSICDLKLPKGMSYSYIQWVGNQYYFKIDAESASGISCVPEDLYKYWFDKRYQNFLNEHYTVYGEEAEEERNAKVVHSFTDACQIKDILYKITAEDYELYIREEYIVKYFAGMKTGAHSTESATVPSTIFIFGTNGTQYFRGTLRGFEERPSVEWLSSFRLVPIE